MTFNEHSLLLILVVSLIVILGAGEIGRAVGIRATDRDVSSISTLEGAVLGLLALMISFTFAMSLSRYESRREAVLNEANSIGTTALRARLLPAPYNTEALKLLRDYAELRVDIAQRIPTPESLNAAIAKSNTLQEALWQSAKAAAAKDNAMLPTGIYIQTLNEMIDNQSKRVAAAMNRLPNIVLLSLYAIAAVASGFTGYAAGMQSRRSRIPMWIMGTLVCGVILLIQDIDRPYVGFIKVSQQPLIDAAEALKSYSD
jgi:hypothetical protein